MILPNLKFIAKHLPASFAETGVLSRSLRFRGGRRFTRCVIVAFCYLWPTAFHAAGEEETRSLDRASSPTTKTLTSRLIFTQVPINALAASSQRVAPVDRTLPDGSRIVLFDPANSDKGVINLTRGFLAAGRPNLSFDGKKVLFVAKRFPGYPFDVWEMNTDGSGLRRITENVGNCTAAIHLSTMYTMHSQEPVYQIAFCSEGEPASARAIHTCRMDGSRVRRITFDPHGVHDPLMLSDGRLVFGGGQPGVSADLIGGRPSFSTVQACGSDLSIFAAGRGRSLAVGMPCETLDGEVIYVECRSRGWDGGGSLVSVPRSRSLHDGRVLADEPSDTYHSPSALTDGGLLVSYRPAKGGTFGLYVFDPVRGKRTARVFDAPDWHDVFALAVHSRPIPAGRSTVVDESNDTGLLYCLDAYLSDRSSRDARNGRIDRVQVFRTVRHLSGEVSVDESGVLPPFDGYSLVEELLGDAKVESDGSFFLKIPARTPLRLQTIDSAGQLIEAMTSSFWVMPNETRGCIGCHEDRERTPPNRYPLALRSPPQLVGVGSKRSTGPGLEPGEEHVK